MFSEQPFFCGRQRYLDAITLIPSEGWPAYGSERHGSLGIGPDRPLQARRMMPCDGSLDCTCTAN
jgi:hypothetical protein